MGVDLDGELCLTDARELERMCVLYSKAQVAYWIEMQDGAGTTEDFRDEARTSMPLRVFDSS